MDFWRLAARLLWWWLVAAAYCFIVVVMLRAMNSVFQLLKLFER